MSLEKIVYGPTIENSSLASEITAELQKYKGVAEGEREFLVVTNNRDQIKLSKAEGIILNADSQKLRRLKESKYRKEDIIYYSRFKRNLIIYSRLKQGKSAVYLAENNLVLFTGSEVLPIVSVDELQTGAISKALFTTAAGFAVGLPLYIVRRIIKKLGG